MALHDGMKRLFVDLSVISQRDAGTGIQRVVRSIWNELARAVSEDIILVPVSGHGGQGYHILPSNFWDHGERAGDGPELLPSSGDIFLGLDLSVRHLPKYEKQFAKWKRDGLLIYLVVYDMLPLMNARWFRWRAVWNFKQWLRFLARQADGAICISTAVSLELRRWLERCGAAQMDATKVHVARLANSIGYSSPSVGLPSDAETIVARMREVPTLLMVGTVEPRKAYDVALDALDQIWSDENRPSLDLIIVGRPGWKTRRLQARMRSLANDNPRFKWLDDVTDEFLSELYQRCVGLVMCSYGEGFGLPLVEAINLGVPVLARDIPIFREISDEQLRYFERDDPVSLSNAISEFVVSNGSKPAQRESKSTSVRSWRDVTDELLAHIERDTRFKMRR